MLKQMEERVKAAGPTGKSSTRSRVADQCDQKFLKKMKAKVNED
jgi:hypothetical protein